MPDRHITRSSPGQSTDKAVCRFCAHEVRRRRGPWRFRRHDIYGSPISGPAPVCVGSRSVFTLELLGLIDPVAP